MSDDNAENMPFEKTRKRVKRVRQKELKIRFSEEEYAQIRAKAGQKSMAEFMREYCLEAPSYQPLKPIKYPKIDPKVLLILAGAANNLNQIARGINQQNLQNKPLDLITIYTKLALLVDILNDIEQQLTYAKNPEIEQS